MNYIDGLYIAEFWELRYNYKPAVTKVSTQEQFDEMHKKYSWLGVPENPFEIITEELDTLNFVFNEPQGYSILFISSNLEKLANILYGCQLVVESQILQKQALKNKTCMN